MKIQVSDKLRDLLLSIDNESCKLLLQDNEEKVLAPNPVVSLSLYNENNDLGNPLGKLCFVKKDGNSGELRVGRIFRHVFAKEIYSSLTNQKEIEEITNKLISSSIKHEFKILESPDVSYWYDQDNYYGRHDVYEDERIGSLWKSCMRNHIHKCGDWFDENPNIKMLGKFKDGLLIGRALLWTNVKSKSKDLSFNFMDRIYTVHDYDIESFINWAEENGYWRKAFQSYDTYCEFINDEGQQVTIDDAQVDISCYEASEGKPYLDTFLYINNDDTVSNHLTLYSEYEARDPEGDELKLQSEYYKDTNLLYCARMMTYVSDKNYWVLKDEAAYIGYKDTYILKTNAVFIDGEYRDKDDVVYSSHYDKDIFTLDPDVVFSKFENCHLYRKDCCYVDSDWILAEECVWSTAQSCFVRKLHAERIPLKTRGREKDYIDYRFYEILLSAYPATLKICTENIHEILNFSFNNYMPCPIQLILNKDIAHKFTPPIFMLKAQSSSNWFERLYEGKEKSIKVALDWIEAEKTNYTSESINIFLSKSAALGFNTSHIQKINNSLILE